MFQCLLFRAIAISAILALMSYRGADAQSCTHPLLADPVVHAAANGPHDVAIADLDGVNGPDLAVVDRISDCILVFLNLGDGTFAAPVDYSTGAGPRSVAIGDLDGVNGPDLAVAKFSDDDVSVLLNRGSFQSERRNIWDARETYFRMSPLLWANQVNGALLMYHGTDDNNSGTFPINSPRMFQALNGLGKPTALYMYPYEGHGPRAQETILDLWARWVTWLDIHVKNPERAKEMYKKAKQPKVIEDNGR